MGGERTAGDVLAEEAARSPRLGDAFRRFGESLGEALGPPPELPEPPKVTARDVAASWAAAAGNWLREARWRWRARREMAVSGLLVAGGLGLACTGGWLIGTWCLGLVLLVIAGGLVYAGMSRDDGAGDRPARGTRTVKQALADERMAQEAEERRERDRAAAL